MLLWGCGVVGLWFWRKDIATGVFLSILQSPVSIGYWLGMDFGLTAAVTLASCGGVVLVVAKYLSTEMALTALSFLWKRSGRPYSRRTANNVFAFRPPRSVRRWRRIASRILHEAAHDSPYLAMPLFGITSVVAGVIVSRTAKLDPTLTVILLSVGNTLKLVFYGVAGVSLWHHLRSLW